MSTTTAATFETTYLAYEFAPLVRLAIVLGAWIASLRQRPAAQSPIPQTA